MNKELIREIEKTEDGGWEKTMEKITIKSIRVYKLKGVST
jgi:hypothetical protein